MTLMATLPLAGGSVLATFAALLSLPVDFVAFGAIVGVCGGLGAWMVIGMLLPVMVANPAVRGRPGLSPQP